MAQPYSEEVQKILDDLLAALAEKKEIDSTLLAELRTMARSGTLENRSQIQRAIANLKAKADELYD
jgi:ribosomal protein L19E